MKNPRTYTQFRCPNCGQSTFGSSQQSGDPRGPLTYYCSGGERRRCGFSWPESDAWKFYILVQTQEFETPEELVAARGF